MLFETFVLLRLSIYAISSTAVLGGALLITFGMFASWNAVAGLERLIRKESA